MRTATIASFTVHVAVLAAFFAIGTRRAFIVPGPDVVQVALISPDAVSAPPPAPAKVEPEPVTESVKPTDETGVRIAPPPRAKPKPKPEKPPEKRPEEAPTTTTLPAQPAGPGGLKGEMVVDAGNFEFTYYLVLVRNRILENWAPPTGLSSGGRPIQATVYFRIDREGEVMGTRLEAASGAEFFDRSALRAVQLSTPMPPLPLGFTNPVLGVHFIFEYAAP